VLGERVTAGSGCIGRHNQDLRGALERVDKACGFGKVTTSDTNSERQKIVGLLRISDACRNLTRRYSFDELHHDCPAKLTGCSGYDNHSLLQKQRCHVIIDNVFCVPSHMSVLMSKGYPRNKPPGILASRMSEVQSLPNPPTSVFAPGLSALPQV